MIRKSILTFMLLAFIGGLMAQNLQFEWEGHVFGDGEEITCTNDEYGYGEIIQHMQIRNLTGNDLNVVIEKEMVQDLEGTMNTFCFGNCYGPDVVVGAPVVVPAQSVSTEDLSFHVVGAPVVVPAQSVSTEDLSFHVIFDVVECMVVMKYYAYAQSVPTEDLWFHVIFDVVEGTVVMKYYAYAQDDPSNKVSIVVRFVYDPSAVNEGVASVGHAYPNPASPLTHFNVQGAENASIAIYNLLGQEVLRQDAVMGDNVISVSELNEGIYFCNLLVDGKAVSTEKLIVK